MKTTLEKAIVAFALLAVVAIFAASYAGVQVVKESGGIKQMIIDAGREVKDIAKQIRED